jgi:hypothetical protein
MELLNRIVDKSKVTIDLRKKDVLKLFFISDVHFGNANVNKAKFKKAVKFIEDQRKEYEVRTILGGDIIDLILISDPRFNPSEVDPEFKVRDLKNIANIQAEMAVEYIKPIQDTLLCSLVGNHEEEYIKRHGSDIYKIYSDMLGCPRLGYVGCAMLILQSKYGTINLDLAMQHGNGGGGYTTGAPINKCYELMKDFEVDLTWIGHLHKMEDTRRERNIVARNGRALRSLPKYFCTNGTFMEKYVIGNRGYAEPLPGKNPDIGMICANISVERHRDSSLKIENNSFMEKKIKIEKIYF